MNQNFSKQTSKSPFRNLPTLKNRPFLSFVFFAGFGFASKIPFGNFGIVAEAKNIFDAKNAMHNSAQSCALRRAEALHLGYTELVPMLMFQLSCSFSSKFSFLVYICFVWLVVSLLIGFVN